MRAGLSMMGGAGAAQLISLLASPILTRLYSPEDYGVFSLASAMLAVISVVLCLRYELAIVLPRSGRQAARVVALCAILCVAVSLTGMAIFAVMFKVLPAANGADPGPMIALLGVGCLAIGAQQISRFWCIRTLKYGAIAAMQLVQAIVTAAVQIWLALTIGAGPTELMVGYAIGLCVSAVAPVSIVLTDLPPLRPTMVSLRKLAAVARRHRRFPHFSAPYGLLQQLTMRGVTLILASGLQAAAVGQFALAQRVVALPVSILMGTSSQLFFGYAAQRIGTPAFASLVMRLLFSLAAVLTPGFVLVAFLLPWLVSRVFGAGWEEAGRMAAILAIQSLFITLTSWLDRTFDLLERQREALRLEFGNNFVTLVTLAGALMFGASALTAICVYVAATCGYVILWSYVTLRLIGVSPGAIIRFGALVAGLILYSAAVGWLCFEGLGLPRLVGVALAIVAASPLAAAAWVNLRPLRGAMVVRERA